MTNFSKKEVFFLALFLVFLIGLPKLVLAGATYTKSCPLTARCACSRAQEFCNPGPNNECTAITAVTCPAAGSNSTLSSNSCDYTCNGCNCAANECWGGTCTCSYNGTGACSYTCAAGYEDANNDPSDGCERNTAPPGCDISFDKATYNLGDLMTINYTNAPANSVVGLDNSNGTVQTWHSISGTNSVTYKLQATDVTGAWRAGILMLSSSPICNKTVSVTVNAGPSCTASFDKDSYNIPDTITINYTNAPNNTTLQLRDQSGNIIHTWVVGPPANSSVTYTLQASDPLGVWDIWMIKIGDATCAPPNADPLKDSAAVNPPILSLGDCTLAFDQAQYILGETMIMKFTKVPAGTQLALHPPTHIPPPPNVIQDADWTDVDTSLKVGNEDNRKYTLGASDPIGEWLAILTGPGCVTYKKATVVQPACFYQKPTITITPDSIPTSPGQVATYTIPVVNNDLGNCKPAQFVLQVNPESCPTGWTCKLSKIFLSNVKPRLPRGPGHPDECSTNDDCKALYDETYICYDDTKIIISKLCIPTVTLSVESPIGAALGTYPISVTVVEAQAGSNFKVIDSADYVLSYCIDLLNRTKNKFNTQCFGPNYDPIADVTKDGFVNIVDGTKIAACTTETCCQKWWDETDPCDYCTNLHDRIVASTGKSCFRPGFDSVADVHRDNRIDTLDLAAVAICQGNQICCKSKWDPIDHCPYCGELTRLIGNSLGKSCSDPACNPLADVNKDGDINIKDGAIIGKCGANDLCCKAYYDPALLNKKCSCCSSLLNKVNKATGTSCSAGNYDPIADTNKDGTVDDIDKNQVTSCGDEACCQGFLSNKTNPCKGSTGVISGLVKNPLKAKNFAEFVDNIIGLVFTLVIVIAPIAIIIAGFYFLTSGGDPTKVKRAKDILLYAVIGLVVVLLAKGIVELIKRVVS